MSDVVALARRIAAIGRGQPRLGDVMGKNQPELEVKSLSVSALKPNPRNPRVYSKGQVAQIARSIKAFGHIVPIIIDEAGVVLAGHGRLAAAKQLKLTAVPTITVAGLSEAKKRAFAIADNKITENAGWNRLHLAKEFSELIDLLEPVGLDLTITGFSVGEIDQILDDLGPVNVDPGDAIPVLEADAVTLPGYLWLLDQHRILCGDALKLPDVERLMDGHAAAMSFNDPPYNVKIAGHVQGRGQIKHREFAFASGEMSEEQFTAFLETAGRHIARVCRNGAIVYMCMAGSAKCACRTSSSRAWSMTPPDAIRAS